MSLLIRSLGVTGKSILVLALASIPVFAAQQHKSESRPSAPHASRPSRPNNQSHSRQPAHPSAGNHGAQNESRPGPRRPSGSQPAGAASRRAPATMGRGTNPNRGGFSGNRGRSVGANRGTSPGRNRDEVMARRGAAAGIHTPVGRTVSLRGGGSASLRPNGQIRSINRGGMQIHNNLHGGRTIVSEHNGTRIVGTGRGNGYVQHSYMTRGGHSYYSRTYYEHGVYRTAVYRSYYYHGAYYYGYHPGFWFHPGFYGWAYRPWGVGITWGLGFGGWGWFGAPWYGFYGGYFAPYPVYPSAAFWLTDYLIAQDLQAAYAARAEARAEAETNAAADQVANDANAAAYGSGSANGPANNSNADYGTPAANSGTVALSPEVKEAIAVEVKAELAAQQQQAAAQGGGDQQAGPAASSNADVPPALDPARRAFVVDNEITVESDGQECELTGGDVITRLTDTPDADNKVTASVSASKKTDCAAGKQITVSVEDLQEMRNHLEEQLNNGMKELAEKQGKGDMPKAPDTGMTVSDIPPPEPDKTAAKELTDQDTAATQTETQAKQEAAAAPGAATKPDAPAAPDAKQ